MSAWLVISPGISGCCVIRLNPIGQHAGGPGSSLVIDITINSSQEWTRSRPGKTGERCCHFGPSSFRTGNSEENGVLIDRFWLDWSGWSKRQLCPSLPITESLLKTDNSIWSSARADTACYMHWPSSLDGLSQPMRAACQAELTNQRPAWHRALEQPEPNTSN